MNVKELTKDDVQEGDKPIVYLAGPIHYADDGGHTWRNKVINEYPDLFTWINPLDFFDGGEDKATILPEEVAENYDSEEDETVITDEELVEVDKQFVEWADAVMIGYAESVPSWGTPQEQLEAHGEHGPKKPVVLWYGDLDEFNDLSPWLRYHDTFRSPNIEECIQHLEAVLDANPLCLRCREESGMSVSGLTFQTQMEDCARCGHTYGTRWRYHSSFKS